jgi:2-C-methyl-D-erythritol 4-phosphate cytidylyltransferase
MGKLSIIITAGGIGRRMGGELPKQFLCINDKPILMHTLELFYRFDAAAQFIITLPSEWREYWNTCLEAHQCEIQHTVVEGGVERYHSIKNALGICTGEIVAVHDGVRPLVARETFTRCIEAVEQYGQVIPAVSVKESLRKVTTDRSIAVDRADFLHVQTPQVFKRAVLNHAYQTPFHSGITDDASLVEATGYPIFLVEGNDENIKITSPNDLRIATFLLSQLPI